MKFLIIILIFLIAQCLFAQQQSFSDASGIGSALTNVINWLTKVLGAAITVIGMVFTGIRLAMHDPDALRKGIWVVIGGLVIFLSWNILSLIQNLAGR